MTQPLNGIAATMFHGEGAIAQCGHCKRYTLDRKALADSRQPACDCGKQHYWSGSFKPPGPDAQWFGPAPATVEKAAPSGLVLRITVAYEQGFGHALRTELSNPYKADTPEHEAWDMGREVGAQKAAQQAAQPVAKCAVCGGTGIDGDVGDDGRAVDTRCPHCDGTGDVHSADGEWRGVCACPAGDALRVAQPVAGEPLFLLHCGQIDSSGEQDDWGIEADSGKRVEDFARQHPGQTIKLYTAATAPVGLVTDRQLYTMARAAGVLIVTQREEDAAVEYGRAVLAAVGIKAGKDSTHG